MGDLKGKTISFDAKFGEIEKFSSQFSKVKAYVAYHGKNRNGTYIDKETFENKLIPTIYGIPVVGEFKEEKEDFGSHGGKLEISDEGIKYVETTKPYGFIDSSSNVKWEMVQEENGIRNEYLVVDVFLWTSRYPEVNTVLNGKNNQSMEIEVLDAEFNDEDYVVIKDGEFSALCILGEDVEPCFESAKISQFNLDKESFKEEFALMVKELKKEFNFEGGEMVEKDENVIVAEENGVELAKNEAEESFENESGESNEENALDIADVGETSSDETNSDEVNSDEEFNNEESGDEESGNEESDEFTKEEDADEKEEEFEAEKNEVDAVPEEKFVKTYEFSHDDIRSKLYKEVESMFETWVWILEVYDEYVLYMDEFANKYYKQSYTKTDKSVSVSEEREEVFAKYLTQVQIDALSEQQQMFEQELTSLREFKAEHDAEIRTQQEEELFNAFSDKVNESDLVSLRENTQDMTIEELEKELYVLAGKKVVSFNFNNKKSKAVVIPVNNEMATVENGDKPYAKWFED